MNINTYRKLLTLYCIKKIEGKCFVSKGIACPSCQVNVPLEVFRREKRDDAVATERQKVQFTLLRAQEVAKDTYHTALVSRKLRRPMPRHTE